MPATRQWIPFACQYKTSIMKPILSIVSFWLLLVVTGCGAGRPAAKTTSDDITLIVVEYLYDPATEQSIRQILRTRRVADWNVRRQGREETIEARYSELPSGIAAEIEGRLRQMPSVASVEIRKDRIPARNAIR